MKEKIVGLFKFINSVAIVAFAVLLLNGATVSIPALFTDHIFQVAILGYVIAAVFGVLAFKQSRFLVVSLVGWAIFGVANHVDTQRATNENARLCVELRVELSCSEDECGFECSHFRGAGFITSGSICPDKDMRLCRARLERDDQKAQQAKDALSVYSDIVDQIVASPTPEKEDFEDQLVAIYHCLQEQYGVGLNELKAVEVLRQKKLTAAQLNKYYAYLYSKGKRVNSSRIVAGLPNGDPSLSCDDIGVNQQ